MMYPYNASQHLLANYSEAQPSTPKKSKPKDNRPVTPRKGCENLTGRYFFSLLHIHYTKFVISTN